MKNHLCTTVFSRVALVLMLLAFPATAAEVPDPEGKAGDATKRVKVLQDDIQKPRIESRAL